jgi:hypothetical protein
VASIREWLETKGLGKYADSFAENEIDFDVLSTLTEEDLDKLGLSVGARRRLALAIKSRSTVAPSNDCQAGLERRLEDCQRNLNEALEQQAATSEVLRAISDEPGNLQAVLDAVAANSGRLCGANDVVIVQTEGNIYRRSAYYAVDTDVVEFPADARVPLRRDFVLSRAILDRKPAIEPISLFLS